MKIKSLEIGNFRSYKDSVKIEFKDINAVIGRNDIGKSTILEAMDIFFNDGSGIIKIDKQDINVEAFADGNLETIITVEFVDLPESIIVDESVDTTLESEYLLTQNGTFKLMKRYKNAGKPSVSIIAEHPVNELCSNLHGLKNKELKSILEEFNIECDSKSINSVMRRAIWGYFDSTEGLDLEVVEIDITKGESKSIYDKVQKFLPVYSLFQADRKNDDTDSEVQDPLKAAIKQILSTDDIQEKLNYVADKVNESLKEVSAITLEKIQEMDENLFETLDPHIPNASELKWEGTFKNVSITGDNNIPINKRGSGIKRIILLNFFRAEAERRSKAGESTNVIYAIEEPETSLHDDKQIQLIDSFKELSEINGTQVILTTHSSTVVKRMAFNDIVLIMNEPDVGKSIRKIHEDVVPYPSLNEVNFLAFGDVTEEYHNELYGIIEENSLLQNFKKDKPTMKYIKIWKGKQTNENKILSEYVRHQIHHPENKKNIRFTRKQLDESIKLMREFLIDKHAQIYELPL